MPSLFCRLRRREAAERGAGMSLMPRRAVTFACAKVTKTPAWGYRPLRTPFSCAVRITAPIKIYSPLSRLNGDVELWMHDRNAFGGHSLQFAPPTFHALSVTDEPTASNSCTRRNQAQEVLPRH